MNTFIRLYDKIGGDYITHFLVGFVISSLFLPFNMPLIALLVTTIFALGKELYDQYTYGNFDWKDFRFTCYGGIIATLYHLLIYFL